MIDDVQPVELKRTPNLSKRRTEFQAAADKERGFRDEANEDYEFYWGDQWSEGTKRSLQELGRPVITDNRIKPMINLLSGYQRMNRYDPEFLPRTSDDIDLCTVRKGLTKYIFDQTEYGTQESLMFLDGIICGRAWMEVVYNIDYSTLDGDIAIQRVSPFDIYVDPESRQPDYSDARYLCRAKWVDKDKLKSIYPDEAAYIEACTDEYDKAEKHEMIGTEPLWYQRETRKVRMIEHWRKEIVQKQKYILMNGDIIVKEDITAEHIAIGIKRPVFIPEQVVIVTVFIGEVLLEEKESPYEHGEFPFIPYTVYYLGEGDKPAGVVRDLKDLQRELNKRRSQSVNILNTQLNSGVLYEQGSIDANQKSNIARIGTVPGAMLEVMPGALTKNKIRFMDPKPPPAGEIQALQETAASIKTVAGINESMLGSDIPSGTSGRAIELRQKAAMTHIGGLFDNQRRTKVQVLRLLWGRKNKKGLVQQYYTEEKSFRIIGENGNQQFMTINKQVPVQDELGNTIYQTLNDMTTGEFDIVISETPTMATQRIAQFWALTDAASKLGIPGDMVFDILLDLCDLPQREELKRRWQERQEAQKQAANAPPPKPEPKINETINFKDLPYNGQVQLAAKLGIDLTAQPGVPPQQGQAQQVDQQAQQGRQQPRVLPQVIQSLPPQILQKLAQMQPQQLAQALAQLEQQLPPQIQQQIAAEIQGITPDQLLKGIHDMIVQLLQSQGNGALTQQLMDPQSVQQSQPLQQPPSNQADNSQQVIQDVNSAMEGNQL